MPAHPAVRLVGRALGPLIAALGVLRRDRPLHPRGTTLRGTLDLDGGALLDGLTHHGPALVRVSRSAGLPAPLPDVQGLALTWTHDGTRCDLLLSGTGTGRVGRFLLVPRRGPFAGPQGSLMPFRTRGGPVVLLAAPLPGSRGDTGDPDLRVDVLLLAAPAGGDWQPVGRFVADAQVDRSALRFDPVGHCPPPLRTYPWASALRVPAYTAARRWGRGRGDDPAPGTRRAATAGTARDDLTRAARAPGPPAA